jgi:hypothetical protein
MSDKTQPMRTPPHPAERYPLREYDVALNDLIGWTRDEVRARLGEPNSAGRGTYWSSHEGVMVKNFMRDASGKIIETAVFGIVPKNIPVGAPYEEWFYHNVRGSTWLLFFMAEGKSPPKVVEVAPFPTGAVF